MRIRNPDSAGCTAPCITDCVYQIEAPLGSFANAILGSGRKARTFNIVRPTPTDTSSRQQQCTTTAARSLLPFEVSCFPDLTLIPLRQIHFPYPRLLALAGAVDFNRFETYDARQKRKTSAVGFIDSLEN